MKTIVVAVDFSNATEGVIKQSLNVKLRYCSQFTDAYREAVDAAIDITQVYLTAITLYALLRSPEGRATCCRSKLRQEKEYTF